MRKAFLVAILIALALMTLVSALPLIGVTLSGALAESHHCRLDEGSAHPCIIAGADRGELLYDMFVSGWLMFFSLPVLALCLLAWFGLLIAGIVIRLNRSRKGAT